MVLSDMKMPKSLEIKTNSFSSLLISSVSLFLSISSTHRFSIFHEEIYICLIAVLPRC